MQMKVPNVAPIRFTRPPNTGMALAITYARIVHPITEPSHTIQCFTVFWLRWTELRSVRTKMNLAASCLISMVRITARRGTYMGENDSGSE